MYTYPMAEIISVQNPKVKHVVKLRTDRRQRLEEGQMLVEGRYEIELAVASGVTPIEVYLCEELSGGRIVAGLDGVAVTVTREVFEKMSQREGPDGWLAVVPIRRRSLSEVHISENPLLILAEAVEKPGNLGAILRTADAAGVDGLLVCDPRVELSNPNIVRASRGTLFTVQAVETTSAEALDWLHEHRMCVVAGTPQADRLYSDVDLSGRVCIAVGTEDNGLSDFWMEHADLKVQIPMMGKVNSLNVSSSTAILLYEAVRQRQRAGENK